MAQEPSTRLPLRRPVLTSRYTEVLRYTGGNAAQAQLEPAVTTQLAHPQHSSCWYGFVWLPHSLLHKSLARVKIEHVNVISIVLIWCPTPQAGALPSVAAHSSSPCIAIPLQQQKNSNFFFGSYQKILLPFHSTESSRFSNRPSFRPLTGQENQTFGV